MANHYLPRCQGIGGVFYSCPEVGGGCFSDPAVVKDWNQKPINREHFLGRTRFSFQVSPKDHKSVDIF